MLKRSSGSTGASTSNRVNQAGGLPYIKAENVVSDPRTLSILAARSERDKWGNDSVVMKVRYDGKLYLWQPNAKNPCFDALIDILGGDESKWAGNNVLVFCEQDNVTEKYYLRVKATGAKKK